MVSNTDLNHEMLCVGTAEYSYQYARTTGFGDQIYNSQLDKGYSCDGTRSVKIKGRPYCRATVRCPKCKDLFTISDYGHHKSACSYSLCLFCGEYFPRVLMDHHMMVCPQREELETPGDSYEDSDQSIIIENEARLDVTIANRILDDLSVLTNNEASNDQHIQPSYLLTARGEETRYYRSRHFGFPRPDFSVTYIRTNVDRNMSDLIDLIEHRTFMMINRSFIHSFIEIIDQFMFMFHDPVHGLSEQEIQALETCKYTKPSCVRLGEEDKCPICIMCFEEDEIIRKLPCTHFFHPNCIDTWLIQNSKCPICKNDLGGHNNNDLNLWI